jgi:hypothetical protein
LREQVSFLLLGSFLLCSTTRHGINAKQEKRQWRIYIHYAAEDSSRGRPRILKDLNTMKLLVYQPLAFSQSGRVRIERREQ